MIDGTSGSIVGMTALPVPFVGFSLGTNICHIISFFYVYIFTSLVLFI